MASVSTRTFNPTSENFYDRLGVPNNAESAIITKAYKKACLQYHPDKNGGSKAAEEAFKNIGEAFATLSDANERAAYDHTFLNQQPPTYQSPSTHDYSKPPQNYREPPKAPKDLNAYETFHQHYAGVNQGINFIFKETGPDLKFFDSSKVLGSGISKTFARWFGEKYMVYLGREIRYVSAKNLGLAKPDEVPKTLKEETDCSRIHFFDTDLRHEELKKNNKVVYIECDVIFSYSEGFGRRHDGDRSYKTPLLIEVVMDARSYKTLETLSREGKITIVPTSDGNVLARKK